MLDMCFANYTVGRARAQTPTWPLRSRRGLPGLAQVDLGVRVHSHQTDEALGVMAGQIVSTVVSRAKRGSSDRYRGAPGGLLIQFAHDGESFVPTSVPVAVDERPPMITVAEYSARRDAEVS